VFDSAGNPLGGAAVLVDLGTFQTMTADDGSYTITGLRPGTYMLRALVPGAFGVPADIAEGVEVSAGQPVTVDFVIDGYPRPPARIASMLVPAGIDLLEVRGAIESVLADNAGRFEELADSLCGSGPGIAFSVAFEVSLDASGGAASARCTNDGAVPDALAELLEETLESACATCPSCGPGGAMTVEFEFGR
jgi:hypothetical protein